MIYNELRQRGTEDFPIELYHIDKSHERYEMTAHWHNELEIIRVIEGELKIKLNNTEYSAAAGDVIFINPETVHRATPSGCVYECIVFNLDFLDSKVLGAEHFTESLKNHERRIEEYHRSSKARISEAVERLFNAMNSNERGRKFRIVGAVYNLFAEIIDSHFYTSSNAHPMPEGKNAPKLRAVLSFIRSNYSGVITLDDMAKAAGMSAKYFCYFFKETTSKTPMEYLTLYRIEKAAGKLTKTDTSVTSIAYACGFNDLSYFIKTFKECKGITPAKYRKQALATV